MGVAKGGRSANDCPHYYYNYAKEEPYGYIENGSLDVEAFHGKYAEENALFLISL